MGNEIERGTAEFNMAVGYLNRLNALFYLADDAAMTLKIDTWMHTLMALFRELSTEMNETEIKKIKDKFQTVNTGVQQVLENTQRSGRMEIPPETYDQLHDVELDLRRVLKESGLQMKMKQGAASALE